jgi:hypothetical protein
MTRNSKEAEPMTTQPAEENKPRRKRGATAHLGLRLDAPKRQGWVRRWVNADPSRITRMEDLGYQLVTDRAGEAESRTDGGGSRIERHTGKDDNGRPTYQVLMETPEEEYAVGVKEKDAASRAFEEAINAGHDTTGRLSDQYRPKGAASGIEIRRDQ